MDRPTESRSAPNVKPRKPVRPTRPLPLLPGARLPAWSGLLMTLGVILVLEVIHQTGLPLPVPAGILLLIVAAASYLEGARRGLLVALAAVTYEVYAYFQHGTALLDASGPATRVIGLVVVTFAVVGMVAVFRWHLDHLLRKEREFLARAEQARQEVSAVLERVRYVQEAMRMQANLLGAVGQGIVATDEFGRITYWNEPAERLFGRTVQEAATRSIDEIIPEPGSTVQSILDRIRRCESWTGEIEVRRPDGSVATVFVSDSPIRDGTGRCTGMVRVATDVTSQKDVERAQRLLADSGSALAGSLDYEATIRTVTRLCVPGFADGCAVDVVEVGGMAWRIEVAHADPVVEQKVRETRRRYRLRLDTGDPVAGVIRTGLPVIATKITDEQLAGFAEDAEHLKVLRTMDFDSAIIVPLRATGRTLGAMVFWRGRSNRGFRETDMLLAEEIAVRAATAIQQARLFETALAANKAKSDFLAVMSHELRTPLTTIVGYTDLMLGGVPGELTDQTRSYVDRIRIAAKHLLGLIEQILVYARLETGREEPRPERIGVARFLNESATLIEPVAKDKGIGFTLDLPPAEVMIETDPTKLRQIVLNLLSNAVKFTERGNVRLAAEAKGGHITVSVSDTGIGIPPGDIDRVFEPFWQVDQSPTRRAGGAGLGLAVTRRLVAYLGGEIQVRSEEGNGTTFRVILPTRWHPPGNVEKDSAMSDQAPSRGTVDLCSGRH